MKLALAFFPILLFAHEYGPDAGVAGVPNEAGTCAQAGCHQGSSAVNAGGGSVSLAFPNGLSYTPGVKQHLVVTIADSAARRWGFQATARLAADTTRMAGTFSPSDARTQLICDVLSDLGAWQSDQNFPNACPDRLPLAYIEHTRAGYDFTQPNPGKYEFDWNPPATNVGPVTIYIAANAAFANFFNSGSPDPRDHIYTATFTVQPACPSGPPSISSVTMLQPGITALGWISIQGCNLASGTRFWSAADFTGSNAPTQLDDVTVSADSQPAVLEYISPTQIIAWSTNPTPASLTVTNSQGASPPFATH